MTTHMKLTSRRRLAGLGAGLALVLLAVGATACSGSNSSSSSTTGTHETTTTVVQYVHLNGHKVRVPLEPDGELPVTGVGTGDQVVITGAGFGPTHLFAKVKVPIVFTNLTSKPQTITFQHFSVQSPSIAPGKTWSWTPTTGVSIVYNNQSGQTGILDIGELP